MEYQKFGFNKIKGSKLDFIPFVINGLPNFGSLLISGCDNNWVGIQIYLNKKIKKNYYVICWLINNKRNKRNFYAPW